MTDEILLDIEDLREVAAYAADNAVYALDLFERSHPLDARPRDAIETARVFARGGKRVKLLRDTAWAALRASRDTEDAAAGQAARAAMCTASAAYLHPLARSTQVRHILGAAAHAARAAELAAGDDPNVAADQIARACGRATSRLVEILCRFPPAPSGGGRVGDLLRTLDRMLRGRTS